MLRREDGNFLRRILDFEVDGQRKKRRVERTWKKSAEGEDMKVGLSREMCFVYQCGLFAVI